MKNSESEWNSMKNESSTPVACVLHVISGTHARAEATDRPARRREWPEIYRKALENLQEPCDTPMRIHRIGRVNSLRSAMLQIHGFTAEEIKAIEESI